VSDNTVNLANVRAKRRVDKLCEADAADTEFYKAIVEAEGGPVVAAAPGIYLIHADYHPAHRVPVLAWRIGELIALPVTYQCTWDTESIIEYPDGIVREHRVGGGGREYENLAAFLAARNARDGRDFADMPGEAEARKARAEALKAAEANRPATKAHAPGMRSTAEMIDSDIPF
jgi:hypothetical protein